MKNEKLIIIIKQNTYYMHNNNTLYYIDLSNEEYFPYKIKYDKFKS